MEDKRGNSRYKRVIERVTDYRRGNPGVEKISARSTLPLPVKKKIYCPCTTLIAVHVRLLKCEKIKIL